MKRLTLGTWRFNWGWTSSAEMIFSTKEMAATALIFSLLHLLLRHHLLIFLIRDCHLCLLIYSTYLTFQGLTNFLTTTILILIFPTVKFCFPMVKCFFPNRPLTAKASSNVGRSTTQTMSGDCLTADLEIVIEKKKPKGRNCPRWKYYF